MHRFERWGMMGSVLLMGLAACGSAEELLQTRAQAQVEEERLSLRAPTAVVPGNTYMVDAVYATREPREILFVFEDAGLVYATAQVQVAAGLNNTTVYLAVPGKLQDPATCRFRASLLPVGGAVRAAILEQTRPVSLVHPEAITEKLTFPFPLHGYPDPFLLRYGIPNHPSTLEARIGKRTDLGRVGIQTREEDGYGLTREVIGLDLESGVMTHELKREHGPVLARTLSPGDSPRDRLGYFEGLSILRGQIQRLFEGLIWHEAFYNPNHPELEEVLTYLDRVTSALGADMADAVALDLSAIGDPEWKTGTTYRVRLLSFAREPRELLLDWLDRRQYYAGHRVSANQGWSARDLYVPVPAPLQDPDSFYLTAKIVPAGAPWTATLDEELRPVPILKDRVTDLALTSQALVPGRDFYLYTSYHARDTRDLRVDLLDATGRWIAGKIFTVKPGAGGQETSLPVPASLPPGQRFTLYVKILPRGAPWSQFYDQKELQLVRAAG